MERRNYFRIFLSLAVNCENKLRPWHDALAIARARSVTRANQEKGGLGGR